jgi:GNAT superfamily N-acetyltransferase
MTYTFRKATTADASAIWEILQQAIIRRKEDGSQQWQDGYPNPSVVALDIEKGAGFVQTDGAEIVGYCALLINDEPAYAGIEGAWLTNGNFVAVHRVAISNTHLGKGLAKRMLHDIEQFASAQNIPSIKADTNFDNAPMLKIFESLGYVYCGEVFFRGGSRKAYEKVLKP